MKRLKNRCAKSDAAVETKRECLLSQASSVSKRESPSFEVRDLAWEASTLPLSYTRSDRIHFSPKIDGCKGEWSFSFILANAGAVP